MDPTAKPTAIGPPFQGQIKIVAELPPGLNKYASDSEVATTTTSTAIPSATVPTTTTKTSTLTNGIKTTTPTNYVAEKVKKEEEEKEPTLDLNLDLRVDIYEAAAKSYQEAAKAKKQLKKCTSCQKQVKKLDGYVKDKDTLFVCHDCFEADKLPENTNKSDFTKFNKQEEEEEVKEEEEEWTEQEELLLLEGLEMFPTDWDAITNHVGNKKTKDHVVLHYLKLPLVDPRIDPQIKKLGLLNFTSSEQQVDNPIMSVVAFLAANVKPQVAASSIFLPSSATDEEEQTEREAMDQDMMNADKLTSTYNLIKAKIHQFSSRLQDFEQVESLIDEQKRQLDKEKFLIRQDHLAIRNQMDGIYHAMFQNRQAKLIQEQQKRMMEQQQLMQQQMQQQLLAQQQGQAQQIQQQHMAQLQTEELMPNNMPIKLPNDPSMTVEERELQEKLRARYPTQYLKRLNELAAGASRPNNGIMSQPQPPQAQSVQPSSSSSIAPPPPNTQ